MPGPLKNARHERFAQNLFKGETIDAAYSNAGFSPNRGNAVRLNANENIRARVAELQRRAADRAEISQERVLKELAKIGFSDIRKAVKWASNVAVAAPDERSLEEIIEDGEIRHSIQNVVELIDSDRIDDETAAAISEISQTDKGGLKIKLHDKRAALVDLGRHLGMFKDGAPTVNLNVGIGLGAFYGEEPGAGDDDQP